MRIIYTSKGMSKKFGVRVIYRKNTVINASDRNSNCEYIAAGRFVLTVYCVVFHEKYESNLLLNYIIA